MKNNSLNEALTDCTESCGWCIHHCPDEDKYEVLVLCIRLQEEFIKIWMNIHSIIPAQTNLFAKTVSRIFSAIAENKHRSIENQKRLLSSRVSIQSNAWQLPGCSQIFLLAQSLGQTLLNESSGAD